AEPLASAGAGKAVILALNLEAAPVALATGGLIGAAIAFQQLPPSFQPLVKAKLAMLTLDLKAEGKIDLRAIYRDADQATDAETAAKEGIKMIRALLAKG